MDDFEPISFEAKGTKKKRPVVIDQQQASIFGAIRPRKAQQDPEPSIVTPEWDIYAHRDTSTPEKFGQWLEEEPPEDIYNQPNHEK